MSSPFIPCPLQYNDFPAGGSSAALIIASRAPTTSDQLPSGYLWLSDVFQGGSGTLYVQSGNSAGDPNWSSLSSGSSSLNTLSDGTNIVTPSGSSNIALEGTANQITSFGSDAAHTITFSIPATFIAPGSIASTSTMTVGTDLTVTNSATIGNDLDVTDDVTIGGDLAVTGTITFGGISVDGTVAFNTSGAGTTTIGNAAAGAITFDVGTGNFQINGGGNEIHIGDDAAANLITIGSQTAAAATLIQSGTGDVIITGATTAEIILGSTTQTGQITIGRSTAGEDISIGSAINASAQIISIGNGASNANSTVNILSGIGTGGAGVLALGNNTRVTTIGIGNIAPAAARVTTIAGGNQAQNDTVTILGGAASAGTQVFNLFSGNSAGATQTINMATGTGAVALNIGTGGTGVKTIAIGGTAANVITIGNTQTAGSVAVGDAMTTGTITIGGTGANTGTIDIAPGTGAQTINIANSTGGKTINLGAGAGANVITIGSVTTTSGLVERVGTGNYSLDGAATSTYTFAPSTTSGTINFGGTGANTGTMTIAGGTGAQTINIANSTGGKTVTLASGAGANILTIGSTNTTSATTINSGSGNTTMVGNVLKTTAPAFLSYLAATVTNKTGNGTTYTIGTDALTEVFDRGTNATTAGVFTAPVTGLYWLKSQVTLTGATIATTFVISIVATSRTATYTFIKAAGSQDETVSIDSLFDMTATDTATTTITVSGEAADTVDILGAASLQTFFTGYLVA